MQHSKDKTDYATKIKIMQHSKDKTDYATKTKIMQHSKGHIAPFMNHRKWLTSFAQRKIAIKTSPDLPKITQNRYLENPLHKLYEISQGKIAAFY